MIGKVITIIKTKPEQLPDDRVKHETLSSNLEPHCSIHQIAFTALSIRYRTSHDRPVNSNFH